MYTLEGIIPRIQEASSRATTRVLPHFRRVHFSSAFCQPLFHRCFSAPVKRARGLHVARFRKAPIFPWFFNFNAFTLAGIMRNIYNFKRILFNPRYFVRLPLSAFSFVLRVEHLSEDFSRVNVFFFLFKRFYFVGWKIGE